MTIYNALPLIPTLDEEARIAGVDTMPKSPKPSRKPSLVRSNRSKGDAPRASEVESLTRKALSLPEARMEKVEALKATIADGNYRVDADDIAKAIIEHMLEEKEDL